MSRKVRILISSPSDVEEERQKAYEVINKLNHIYYGRLELIKVFWEDLPLGADKSFQEGIDLILSEDEGIDIAIFVLWSRLGTPLDEKKIHKKDGSQYLSGTERELDLMLDAYNHSKSQRPTILAYLRNDHDSYLKKLELKLDSTDDLADVVKQKKLLENFINDNFYDHETKTNKRAFHNYETPHSFSNRFRTHLKSILDKILNESGDFYNSWDVLEKGSPFRGLEVFEMDHANVFHGRSLEICDIQQSLRDQANKDKAFLLLLGASGSGKSSLVRAGVIPTIMEFDVDEEVSQWRVAIMNPNQSPSKLCIGLAQALCDKKALPELKSDSDFIQALGDILANDPKNGITTIIKPIYDNIHKESSQKIKLLFLVDQLEELFMNPAIKKNDAITFLKAIRYLSQSGLVWVISTLRNDFYYKVQEFSDLMYLKDDGGQKDILYPERSSMKDIILEPAKLAGLKFETKSNESLADKILNDAMENPEALPLVEYTLNELFKNRSEEMELTFEQYEALGGIEGAIGKRAEQIFGALSEKSKELAPRFFRSLASINSKGQFSSRPINTKEINDHDLIKDIIDTFLDSRLIIIQKNNDTNKDSSIIKITHEALFKSWERYNNWLTEERSFLEIRQKLEFSMNRALNPTNGLYNYFIANRDLVTECAPLSNGSELSSTEAEFIFRSSLASGYHTEEWSKRLKKDYPNIRVMVMLEALKNTQPEVRKNAISLLACDQIDECSDQLTNIVLYDKEASVRKESARTLAENDKTELYGQIIDKAKKKNDLPEASHALSLIKMVVDETGKSPRYYEFHKELKPLFRKKVFWNSTVLRTRKFLLISPFLVIPTILLASISATFFKSIPGYFNWAISQSEGNAIMGAFHGATAGIIWAGVIVLGITIYYNVFGKKSGIKSTFFPTGAIITGLLFGVLGSLFIIMVVLGVYRQESLIQMGWLISDTPKFSSTFFEEVFLTTKFGWCYIITGTSLGIGIALTLNNLNSSEKWLSLIENQKKIASYSEFKKVFKTITTLVFKHALPLIIPIILGCLIAYQIPDIPPNLDKFTSDYNNLALSLIADSSTQAFGAFFAIIGLSLGLVIIKNMDFNFDD